MLRNLLSVLVLCLVLGLRAEAQDRSSPEAAVRSFITAVELGDVKLAMECVKGSSVNEADQGPLAQRMQKEPVSLTLRHAKTVTKGFPETLVGMTATVTGEFSIIQPPDLKRQTFNTTVNLVITDGKWQIAVDGAKKPGPADTDAINMFAYAFTDQSLFKGAAEKDKAVTCVSNVKQMGLATILLVQDFDEIFKVNAATFNKDLTPYLKSQTVFKCPSDTGTGISYSFNAKLAGIGLANVQSPAQTVMIYEGKNGKLDFRHDGKACVGFVDGHARLVDANEAKTLHWAP